MEDNHNIRNLQTMLRVIASTTHEIPLVIPDGIYGKQTAASVRALQTAGGLPVTGKVDEKTWQAILAAYEILAPRSQEPAPLRIILDKDAYVGPAAPSAHTYLIQAQLLALSRYFRNFPALAVTGTYDAATERAVKTLQRSCGLPENGLVDRKTWSHLVSLYRLTAGDGKL